MMLNADTPPPAVAPAAADTLSSALITSSGARFEITSGDFASRVMGMKQRLHSGELRDEKKAELFIAEILTIPPKERDIIRNWCVDRNNSILMWDFAVKLSPAHARQAIEAFYPGLLQRAEILDSLSNSLDLRTPDGLQALKTFTNSVPADQKPLLPICFSIVAKGVEVGEGSYTRPKFGDRIADRSGSERLGIELEDAVLGIPYSQWDALLANDPAGLVNALNAEGSFARAIYSANWENRAWATTSQPGITLTQYITTVFEKDSTGAALKQSLHL